MKKYLISRRAVVDETFAVEAEDMSDLTKKIQDGDIGMPITTEWVDWHDETFDVVHEEELDPLYVMVRDHKLVDKLDN